MATPLTLIPRLPPRTLAEVQDAAGIGQQQQQVICIRSGFGTNTVESDAASGSLPDLPLGWTGHTHPKGLNYYSHADNQLITPVNPQPAENIQLLESAFAELNALLPPDWRENHTHIVLFFTEEQRRKRYVEYHLADYSNERIFWVLPEDAERVGLQPYPNVACLRSMLRSHFWNHVYYFPSTAPLDIEAATRRLTTILNLGRVLGNAYSTPWTPEDCTVFLQALQTPTVGPPHYTTAVVGQLNAVLTGYQHILTWGAYNNGPLLLPRRGANHPIALVFRRRGDGVARLRFSWLTSLLIKILLFSAYMACEGMFMVSKESANPAIFIHTFVGCLLLFLCTPVLNTLECLDRRIPVILAHSPRLSLSLVLLASFDVGVYGLFVDDASRLLAEGSSSHIRMGQVVLKLIIPPMLILLTLVWRYRDPRLHPA